LIKVSKDTDSDLVSIENLSEILLSSAEVRNMWSAGQIQGRMRPTKEFRVVCEAFRQDQQS